MKGGAFVVYYSTKAYKEANTCMIYEMLQKMMAYHKHLHPCYFDDLGCCDKAGKHQVP